MDFVYIDARHDYESVLEDLNAWFHKVKPGGILAGHDYADGMLPQGDFGVKSAVDEFFAEQRHPGARHRGTLRRREVPFVGSRRSRRTAPEQQTILASCPRARRDESHARGGRRGESFRRRGAPPLLDRRSS